MNSPKRSGPVFSTEDFRLIKEAVSHFIKTVEDDELAAKYINLFHRLGRSGQG
jgi:hypothetical protein